MDRPGGLLAIPACAAELQPKTVEAFDRYIRETEQRLTDSKIFLWADESVDRARRVKAGAGWLVQPIIRDLPKESLANALRLTRAALAK